MFLYQLYKQPHIQCIYWRIKFMFHLTWHTIILPDIFLIFFILPKSIQVQKWGWPYFIWPYKCRSNDTKLSIFAWKCLLYKSNEQHVLTASCLGRERIEVPSYMYVFPNKCMFTVSILASSPLMSHKMFDYTYIRTI